MSSLIVARFTLKEALRKRFFLMAAIAGIVFLALYALGLHFVKAELVSQVSRGRGLQAGGANVVYAQLVLAGLFLIHLLGILVAIAVSVAAISQEVDEGTVQLVATKPLGRWEIVAGKWLGMAAVLAVYVLGMGWGVMAVAYYIAGFWPAQPVTPTLLMLLASLSFLSLSLLGGSFLPTLANALLLLTIFGMAFFGGMVEQIGALVQSEAMVNIGIGTSLLAPTDALWRLAARILVPNMGLPTSPFSSVTEPSAWMVAYAGFYACAAFLGAAHVFGRRDL